MNRWWTEHVADLFDRLQRDFNLNLPWETIAWGVLLLLLAGLVVLIVRQARKNGWGSDKRRSRAVGEAALTDADLAEEPDDEPEAAPDHLPDLNTAVLAGLADQYAAQGRYAEAVRERLRAIVRSLIEAGVIVHSPGWTVTELAAAAGTAYPPIGPALTEASRIFSDIWYGQRPATVGHDARMREVAGQVAGQLRPVGVR